MCMREGGCRLGTIMHTHLFRFTHVTATAAASLVNNSWGKVICRRLALKFLHCRSPCNPFPRVSMTEPERLLIIHKRGTVKSMIDDNLCVYVFLHASVGINNLRNYGCKACVLFPREFCCVSSPALADYWYYVICTHFKVYIVVL